MAISGSGGWTPSVRVVVRKGRLVLNPPIHNVPKSVTHPPDIAVEILSVNPMAYIYVPVGDEGGTWRLNELLKERGIVYDSSDVEVGRFNDA